MLAYTKQLLSTRLVPPERSACRRSVAPLSPVTFAWRRPDQQRAIRTAPEEASLTIDLKAALHRARQYSQQFQSASIWRRPRTRIMSTRTDAGERGLIQPVHLSQRTGCLPASLRRTMDPTSTDSLPVVHGEIYSPVKLVQYRQTAAPKPWLAPGPRSLLAVWLSPRPSATRTGRGAAKGRQCPESVREAQSSSI